MVWAAPRVSDTLFLVRSLKPNFKGAEGNRKPCFVLWRACPRVGNALLVLRDQVAALGEPRGVSASCLGQAWLRARLLAEQGWRLAGRRVSEQASASSGPARRCVKDMHINLSKRV